MSSSRTTEKEGDKSSTSGLQTTSQEGRAGREGDIKARGMNSSSSSLREVAASDQSERKRVCLSSAEKKRICEYHVANPTLTHAEIGAKLGLTIDRTTVSKVLKQKERWLRIDERNERETSRKRRRSMKFPEVCRSSALLMLQILTSCFLHPGTG